ncbi:MAG TPA: InlB B-repeat-containing protein [Lachnospiraceae bacterium]|nr:InlB B-repeat-containing protein [Lachnospiraceae bacterium]
MLRKYIKQMMALLIVVAMLSSSFMFSTVPTSAEGETKTTESAETVKSTDAAAGVAVSDTAGTAAVESTPSKDPESAGSTETASGQQASVQASDNSQKSVTDSVPETTASSEKQKTESKADTNSNAAGTTTNSSTATSSTKNNSTVTSSAATSSTTSSTASSKVTLSNQTITASIYTDSSYSTRADNGTTITLSGQMPENAVVKAYPVTVAVEGQKTLAAFDITIITKDGNAYEPASGAIEVNIDSAKVKSAISENADLEVYHLDNAEAEPKSVPEVKTTDHAVVFSASAFSIYAVTSHYTHTYNFKNDEGTVFNTQILSEGETLKQPETPTKAHAVFIGWEDESGTVINDLFSRAEGVLKEDATTNLTPVFENRYYVHYMSEDGNSEVYSQTYTSGTDTVNTSNVPFITASTETALVGWTTTKGGTTPDAAITLNNDDLTLYPVVKAAHWIMYESNGGTSVNPAYVLSGGKTVAPTAPTRTGYSFDGWYSDKGLTTSFTFGQELTGNITVYAKWTEATTNYTVIIWKQKVSDDVNLANDKKSYDYEESISRTATTGSKVKAASADTSKNYYGFYYRASDSDVFVNADGSTVVNVYYDRTVVTINYYVYSNDQPDTYITGLFGRTFKSGDWRTDWRWVESDSRTTMTMMDAFIPPDKIPTNSKTYTFKLYANDKKTGAYIYHYKQNFDGTYGDPANTIETSGGTFYFSNKYEGFTVNSYKADNADWEAVGDLSGNPSVGYKSSLLIQHTRNSSLLKYFNVVDNAQTAVSEHPQDKLLYQQPLGLTTTVMKGIDSKAYFDADTAPAKPSTAPDYYEFKGWFEDPQGTTKFDFTQTMPNNNLVAYAVWGPKTVTVTFDTQGGSTVNSQPITAGTCAVKPTDPTRTGYKFAGWTKTATTDPYNFSTVVTSDITLYAQWVSDTSYTVTYNANGGNGADVTDASTYDPNTGIKIQAEPAGWTGPTDENGITREFVSWNTKADGTGTTYYPGDSFKISANTTLYAQWAVYRTTTLKLDYNNGSNLSHTETFKGKVGSDLPNTDYTLLSQYENMTAPDGYSFLNWNTAADGSGTAYAAGTEINVDTLSADTNVLYAQWSPKLTICKTVAGGMGDTSKDYYFKVTVANVSDGQYGDITITNGDGWVSMKSGESKAITGLPKGTAFTIKEVQSIGSSEEFNSAGYTTEYKINDADAVTGKSASGTLTSPSKVSFVNTRKEAAPTALKADVIPYMLIILMAFAFGLCLYLKDSRKKSSKD